MNKARNRKHWTPCEAKQRNKIGKEIEKAFRVFTGYYKGILK